MPGRPTKPTALKLLHGDDKKNPQRFKNKEPDAPKGLPECPSYLKGHAKRKWNETIKVLSAMHIVSPAERTLLEHFCVAYDEWRRAETRIDKIAWGGMLHKLNTELGLSYLSRSRVNIEKDDKPTGIKERSRA